MSDFIEIPLSQGKIAIIDAEDFELVNQWKWTVHVRKNKTKEYCSARRTIRMIKNGKSIQRTVFLHRFVMNAPDGVLVDHKNGNGLDCRKSNLRFATVSENQANSQRPISTISGFRGVYFNRKLNKYFGKISHNNKIYYLGVYENEKDAAIAYDRKAVELFGEFATLNFSNLQKTQSDSAGQVCKCIFNFDDKFTEHYCDVHYAEMSEAGAMADYYYSAAA